MASQEAKALKVKLGEILARLSGDKDNRPSLEEMRAEGTVFGELASEPEGVTWTKVDAGGVPSIWADSAGGSTDRVVQYVHGGGYVIGSAAAYSRFTGHLAKSVGCRVLSVDYRLAPENPHPAAVEDSTKAYRWLLQQGYDPSHIAISGDSAGGGLTLATLLSLRDAGTPLPAAAVPISPWVDMEGTGETMATNAGRDVLVQAPMLHAMALMFLGGGSAKDPLASPLHADYSGIPEMYIQVGGDEALLDDARRVTKRAQKAGVDVTLEIFPEMQHVFQIAVGGVPESDDAVAKIGAYLRPRLGL